MEVVEVARRFQITPNLWRPTAGKPARTVMWMLDLVSYYLLDLSDRSKSLQYKQVKYHVSQLQFEGFVS